MRRLVIFFTTIGLSSCGISEYLARRANLAEAENFLAIGGNYSMDPNETVVNNCLMQLKFKELDYAFDNPQYFNFSHHFFVYKNKMRESKVYKIIKDMPKGAALHIHDTALLGPDYIMNITYMNNLYLCFGPNLRTSSAKHLFLRFANQKPNDSCSEWQLISDIRHAVKNVTDFDHNLRKHFTLVVDDPDTVYPSIREIWDAMRAYFSTMFPLLSYRPVREQYIYDALKKFRDDNIMYIELRSRLADLYELDGTLKLVETAKIYQKTLTRFKKNYPDFVGAKIIYSPSRFANKDELSSYLATARSLKNQVPDIFAGFDLIGQEDKGKPLIEFASELLEANDMHFFFHAGETDWYGTPTDSNLYDAILLGAKRIGHGYALTKHPLLMKEIDEKDIGLEINLISNSVLSLVRDLRNHPLNTYIASGMPVVISSDDPGAWEAEPASDDFYVAFVAASSRQSDLRLLKTLAENSFKYSALETRRKTVALENFHTQWKRFVDNFDCFKY